MSDAPLNPGGTSALSLPHNTQPKRNSRTAQYIRWRNAVSEAYTDAGMDDVAELWDSCSDPAHFFHMSQNSIMPSQAVGVISCSDNPEHFAKAVCPSCQLRTCPDCAHREGARLLARYMPTLEKYFHAHNPRFRFKKLVFTSSISVRDPDISQKINDLYQAVRKTLEMALNQRSGRKYTIRDVGAIVAAEFGPNGHKLHFHMLFYGPFIDQALLARLWHENSGQRVLWIEKIGQGNRLESLEQAVAETLKYTTKFWKRDQEGNILYIEPEIVPLIHQALHGTRRVRSWGLFYSIREPQEKARCPVCDALLTKLSPVEWDIWQQTGWLPDELNAVLHSDVHLNLKLGNKSPPDEVPKRLDAAQERLL